jgi:hypothetical protein
MFIPLILPNEKERKRESDTDIKRSEQKRKFTHDSEGKKNQHKKYKK